MFIFPQAIAFSISSFAIRAIESIKIGIKRSSISNSTTSWPYYSKISLLILIAHRLALETSNNLKGFKKPIQLGAVTFSFQGKGGVSNSTFGLLTRSFNNISKSVISLVIGPIVIPIEHLPA